ncbi:RcnB family protein [Acinetobacter sp. WZC-1]|uniref:RcnB family protein n=1 Tax=Acinetobacter sp. WZC-1 TaxID=3459034 RepID=UPI00403DC649
MKQLLTAITLSLSALMASSVMAAPYASHHQHESRYAQQQRERTYSNSHRYNQYDRYKRVNPGREWRSGQYLPNQFTSSRYVVNYRHYQHLPRPGRNQQWLKINGDYVLVNARNHRIIRIIG